jgi:hypothetical protein
VIRASNPSTAHDSWPARRTRSSGASRGPSFTPGTLPAQLGSHGVLDAVRGMAEGAVDAEAFDE